jgi:tetratricopeptide (TPR) repeat protein
LLPSSLHGQKVFVQNNRFGWRFFGREVARWPCAFSITQSKPTNTVRILVLGESAARGEPQPDFGLSRVLESLLSLRHPGVRFEVVNTAMTAINSHAILPIARDCARVQGDIWVIYMGNNEVVGPFGAGTVFGSQSPPLPLIRASLALKATRTGQFLDSGLQRIRPAPPDDTVWGGMTMFLSQQVRADNARMQGVYHHFERNLADIIRAGQRSGAAIVVSTVAVNLKDCAPFASAHRPGLSETDKSTWGDLYQRGSIAQGAGEHVEAAEHFRAAAALDDTFAELRFRQGQCALALGETAAAQRHFAAARDWDTLRFRSDTRLNELIRQTAANRARERVLLADPERAFAERSSAGLPGDEFFYEHVHLTFEGNYLLARTIAEQVAKLLPAWVDTRDVGSEPWPAAADCARRLARSDWHEAAALSSIMATLQDPPFPGQLGHDARMRRLEASLANLSPALEAAGIADALKHCRAALAAVPDDPVLHKQLAILSKVAGDFSTAAAAARRELELLPGDSEGWALLGSILARQARLDEAADAFRRAFQLGPQGIKSSLDLAAALATLNRHEEAIQEYKRILAMKPRCVPALLQLGQIVEKEGRHAEAGNYFRQALTNRSQRLPELMELGTFFQSRGDHPAAVEVYTDALELSPANAALQLAAGRNLASLGRYEEAARHAAEAVRLAPEFVEARLLHGITLWQRGMAAEAMGEFQEALRLRPESLDARVNLGMALTQQGRRAEALAFFREVLQRNPTNAVALKYVQSLSGGDGQPGVIESGKAEGSEPPR